MRLRGSENPRAPRAYLCVFIFYGGKVGRHFLRDLTAPCAYIYVLITCTNDMYEVRLPKMQSWLSANGVQALLLSLRGRESRNRRKRTEHAATPRIVCRLLSRMFRPPTLIFVIGHCLRQQAMS